MSEPVISSGCILIARKIVESEIWKKPPLYIKVWLYLLTQAQHKKYKQLDRGQLRTSIPEIIHACSWYIGARIERPTKDQIFQIIEWLRKPHEGGNEGNARAMMISTTKATHGMIITIDNYGFYQTMGNYESNAEDNDENQAKAQRRQRTPDNINNNGINDKNKRLYGDHVLLTDEEHERLTSEWGADELSTFIDDANYYFIQKPEKIKNYKNHNLMLRRWKKIDISKGIQKRHTRSAPVIQLYDPDKPLLDDVPVEGYG